MALHTHFRETCSVTRLQQHAGTTDQYGNTVSAYQQVATGVACLRVQKSKSQMRDDGTLGIVSLTYVYMGGGSDVRAGDRLTDFKPFSGENDAPPGAEVLEVESVRRVQSVGTRSHHVTAITKSPEPQWN